MREINFLESLHTSTKRDYLARVTDAKPYQCEIAKLFGADYWDGSRDFGYGGYHYDGRWKSIAEDMIKHYDLKQGDRIFDIGCGKGHLLLEFRNLGMKVQGVDISEYAKANAPEEIQPFLWTKDCRSLPWEDGKFDFVYSINTFHNLQHGALTAALSEMKRVGKNKKWFCVESYRTEREKCNMLNWQLTCESFHRPDTWKEIAERAGYDGDIGFIFFE